MKQVFTIMVALLCVAGIFAQAPEKISYQAVIRNASNNLVVNQSVGMQISILQGSASGTAVYVETQTPTTNANGLISIEIGGGTVVSGTFSTIDWANGPYFIKTEIDPSGNTSYSITGTSQLLSVPYSLHAKTADTAVGKGGHYVGEFFGGGIIFWLDHTGQHGLIISLFELGTVAWSNVTNVEVGTNDWDGRGNTAAIIAQAGHTNSAAKLCDDYINADYGTGVYSDWYLPSMLEIKHLCDDFHEVQKALITDGNPATTPFSLVTYCYSSTEFGAVRVWRSGLNGVTSNGGNGKSDAFPVRAVRSF